MDQPAENSTTPTLTIPDKQPESSTDAPTKPELSDDQQKEIASAFGLGMPWPLIAALIEMTMDELASLKRREPDLAKVVRKAEAECMKGLLEKLNKAQQWQASTFLLQSRWPGKFGRNRKPRVRKKTEPSPTKEMFGRLKPDEFEMWTYLTNKMNGDDKSGKPRPDSDKRGENGTISEGVRSSSVESPRTSD